MDSRKIILMAGALLLAVACALMARSMFGGTPAPAAPLVAQPTGPEVLVAVRALPAGTILTPEAFRYQPWPDALVDQAYFIKGRGQPMLAGTVVRFPITAGQPITQGAVVKPGDRGFLAAALGPGMRAVTIQVSAESGVAGFVFPGDRIDLLLTQTVAGGGDGPPLKATETIVRNLRVLATDQRTDKTVDDAGKTVVATFSNVTLEATPKLSEKIAVAGTIGALSLSLRPIADDKMELERQIAAGEIDVPNDPKAEKQMLLEVASRPVDTETTFTTGGQVSRFQTNRMPGRAPAAPAAGAAPAAAGPAVPPRPRGPTVSVMRGQTVTEVAVGGGF